ncbi:MAG: DUF4416 family protein [Candidatus Omnitrophota bacterium]|nr:DUF4416 family protein [Candidatus Omnitrophota bacterium]
MIIGFIFCDEAVFKNALTRLVKRFGKIDFESRELDFTYTDYYRQEFGPSLKRKFIGFFKLIDPAGLFTIKDITNNIEKKLSGHGRRNINIDPGYVCLSKLVLATTKDYAHRVYLNRGIYAEIALTFKNKSFTALDWTYPDYRSAEYIAIFNQIREIYAHEFNKPKNPVGAGLKPAPTISR